MTYDESFDFVIVGSGAASVPAALVAQSAGKTAVILEKQDKFGGSTGFSGGVLWIPNSPLHGSDDSEEAGRTYLNAVIAATGDPGKASPVAKREMFLKEGPKSIQFLLDRGVKLIRVFWPDYYSNLPGGHEYGRSIMAELFNVNELGEWKDKLGFFWGFPRMPVNSWEFVHLTLAKRTWRGRWSGLGLYARMLKDKLTGSQTVGSGQAVQGRLLQVALKNNVPIRLENKMVDLLTENGKVTGVKVETPQGTKTIEARRGVLLNTGGFSHNLEMRQEFQPQPASTAWTQSNPGDTGEGIQIARKLGADIDLMNEAWWTPGSLMPDGSYAGFHVPGEAGKPGIIIVNKKGRRVANEAGAYMEFGQRMFADAENSVPCYAIITADAFKHYTWSAIRPGGATVEQMTANGYLTKAETMRELAEKMGIDPAGLEDEVAKFNRFADKGVDEDFGRGGSAFSRAFGDPTNKPNPSLGKFGKGPFYSVKIWPLDVGTSGGLVTDEYARVLKEDGAVIEGLYATGNATAPVVGRAYPGAGASIGGSVAFGYVAAKHALGVN